MSKNHFEMLPGILKKINVKSLYEGPPESRRNYYLYVIVGMIIVVVVAAVLEEIYSHSDLVWLTYRKSKIKQWPINTVKPPKNLGSLCKYLFFSGNFIQSVISCVERTQMLKDKTHTDPFFFVS